ncbi:hypothetical protein SAMN05443572_101846 [Myxococcus fulvus]|uniref:Uncharacterized protein n=1 Tax=Myxococcus fulvus TaxID=33 RepID=A0A511SUL9_MYXFU|nr:hypothetical protein [Myxococcus fulvus]GEN05609.1 hypothetical protein MFU01_06460 [Myxococcus fulvus]SET01591.1 hypothetical protein SAMN05443572_101846 [Myxococcus fulvus]
MSKVRWGVMGLAGAVVLTAGVWSSRGDAPGGGAAPVEAARASANTPADLEREVRALRAELEALRQRQGRLEQPPSPVAPQAREDVPVEEDSAPSREAAMVVHEQRRQERVLELEAELEVAMNTEPRDTAWAGSTESLVTESFRGKDFAGSRLTRVECRTHLCTLEVEHEGNDAQAELLISLSRVPGLRGQTVVRPHNEGGRVTSRVYLSRAGERLPMTLRR